ncbi:MAG: hypothetical protein LBS21_09890 [Clostridiales bacterium]|jgi:hypothetical protein|nr:hypothetical protein [Clostridiales bacterium]
MVSNEDSERNAETPLEIEKDMRTQLRAAKSGKVSIQDYVEAIAYRYPLLGMAVLDENSRQSVERTALQVIKHSFNCQEAYSWAYLTVLLTVIQYAKDWTRAENSGFWAYIAEQFGYKDSSQIYEILTSAVKTACQKYNRFFVVDTNGDNNYYSTVLAHALSPRKSFYALFEFLVKFYKNNLDCAVYADDPAIGRMASVLRDRCQGVTVEQDEDIRGNIYGVQAGLKVLITTRPGFMKHFLTKALQKMDILFDGGELPGKEYLDVLLMQWYISKLNEPSSPILPSASTIPVPYSNSLYTSIMSPPHSTEKNAPVHKRTTDVAFSYSRIRAEYTLDDGGEPAIRIPSIRLASRDNPVIIIHSGEEEILRNTVGIYGNDYAATSEEVIIPLTAINSADFTKLNACILISGKQIFSSGCSLCVNAILFKNGKLQTRKTIDPGNYMLFAPKSINIAFQGSAQRQRRSYFAQLYDIYLEGEASIFADGNLLCCLRPPEGALRFKLPQTQINYVYQERYYPIYSRAEFSISAVGTSQSSNVNAILQNGEQLSVQSKDDNLWQFIPPQANGEHSVTLLDTDSGRIFDEINFYITDNRNVSFNRSYYIETCDNGNVVLNINEERFEKSLNGFEDKAKIPFGDGEIQIQIPKIKLLLDGSPIPKDVIWKGEISPSSILKVIYPESLPISLFFGDSPISRRSSFGGSDYSIGNAVQAYDKNDDKVSVNLLVDSEKFTLFDVVFKMSLCAPPVFNLSDNTLSWLNGHSFVGDKDTKLMFVFSPKHISPVSFTVNPGERVLSENFPSKSEKYRYQVFTQNETAFGKSECLLYEGDVIFGDKFAVIFKGEVLRITKTLTDGNYTEIKPVFANNISYVGTENLGYTDLSGDYAHYTANLYFSTRNGPRYFTNFNPVDIYLISETARRLHISFDGGEGLFIDKSGDYGVELYKHTDPPQKLARFFSIPDFFEYDHNKEMN